MLKTRPGKGREKAPPKQPRPPKPPSPELPKVEFAEDFDRVLRGLLAVPASVKPKPKLRPKKKRPKGKR